MPRKNTKNKDTTKGLFLKDQDQDLSVKNKYKDLSSKDQDQDFKFVLKDSLRTRTRTRTTTLIIRQRIRRRNMSVKSLQVRSCEPVVHCVDDAKVRHLSGQTGVRPASIRSAKFSYTYT